LISGGDTAFSVLFNDSTPAIAALVERDRIFDFGCR